MAVRTRYSRFAICEYRRTDSVGDEMRNVSNRMGRAFAVLDVNNIRRGVGVGGRKRVVGRRTDAAIRVETRFSIIEDDSQDETTRANFDVEPGFRRLGLTGSLTGGLTVGFPLGLTVPNTPRSQKIPWVSSDFRNPD